MMARLALLWIATLFLALGPNVVRADEAVTLVSDASNDAGVGGVPVPAALAAWELHDVVLVEETEDAFVVLIGTGLVPEEAPPGEFGLHFRVGLSWWLVGWTTIVFPSVPPFYRGGFYCETDEELHADVSTCAGLWAEATSEGYRIVVNRTLVRAAQQGAVLDQPSAYADAYNSDGTSIRIDAASGDGAYTFQKGIPNGTSPVDEPAPTEPSVPPVVDSPEAIEEEAAAGGSAPGFGWALLVAAAALVWRRPGRIRQR